MTTKGHFVELSSGFLRISYDYTRWGILLNEAIRTNGNDSELLRSMLTGDEEALVLLCIDAVRAGIYRFAYQMSGSATFSGRRHSGGLSLSNARLGNLYDPNRGSLSSFLVGRHSQLCITAATAWGQHFLTSLS